MNALCLSANVGDGGMRTGGDAKRLRLRQPARALVGRGRPRLIFYLTKFKRSPGFAGVAVEV